MSEKIDDGGAAFPQQMMDIARQPVAGLAGMSLRDYFAAKAMLGLFMQWGVQQKPLEIPEKKTRMASFAYELADAMLAARKAQAK